MLGEELSMQETTTSSMVPGAHIEVAFQKLGLDAKRFLQGDEPDKSYYTIQNNYSPGALPSVLESLYSLQEADASDETIEITNAVIENLTTRNHLTNEELAWLYDIAQGGGVARLRKVEEKTTPGMGKALSKIKFKGCCGECGFKVPKYTGRYPNACPECGQALSIKDSLMGSPSTTAEEVHEALNVLGRRLHLIQTCGLNEEAAETFATLPEGSTRIQRLLVGDLSEGNHESEGIFESLVCYLLESKTTKYDGLVRVLFEKYPIRDDPNMVTTLREEVAKRDRLVSSILSLRETGTGERDRDFFRLNKALASCYTRVMIEGETTGGTEYRTLGRCIFEMMQRAMDGHLEGPARFLNTYFLRG